MDGAFFGNLDQLGALFGVERAFEADDTVDHVDRLATIFPGAFFLGVLQRDMNFFKRPAFARRLHL